ncbi:MAG: hypothetical protein ACYDEJ_09535 [Desulfitobacteriaceae bacterium]
MMYSVKETIGGQTYGVTYSKLSGLKPILTGDAVAVKFIDHKSKTLQGRIIDKRSYSEKNGARTRHNKKMC